MRFPLFLAILVAQIAADPIRDIGGGIAEVGIVALARYTHRAAGLDGFADGCILLGAKNNCQGRHIIAVQHESNGLVLSGLGCTALFALTGVVAVAAAAGPCGAADVQGAPGIHIGADLIFGEIGVQQTVEVFVRGTTEAVQVCGKGIGGDGSRLLLGSGILLDAFLDGGTSQFLQGVKKALNAISFGSFDKLYHSV